MADTTFTDAWEQTLTEQQQGLDLTDAEDRADYRGRVKHVTRYLGYWGHRELAAHLGVQPAQSKEATARRIADAWIRRTGVDFR